MACQSMLIVLVGSTPEYRIEQQDGVPSGQEELLQRVIFTEDIDSIVTEVREFIGKASDPARAKLKFTNKA